MVPLTNSTKSTELLVNEQQLLYKKLLDCSIQQLSLVNKRDEEQFPILYGQTIREWGSLVGQIETIQEQLDTTFSGKSPNSLIEIVQQIAFNIDAIENLLQEHESNLGEDMNTVSNQKKIMNAYYGAHITDSSSIYFDEKK